MVLMYSRRRSSPSATILAGVSATLNEAGVALLTPASVACADSTTATMSVNGSTCRSSPRGRGLAAAKRRNASSISAVDHCGSAPLAALASAAALFLGPLGTAALRDFAARRACLVV